jgi:hypothetical protein
MAELKTERIKGNVEVFFNVNMDVLTEHVAKSVEHMKN